MDSAQTFQVVLQGLNPRVSVQDAKQKLAALFKATPEQVDRLLAAKAYVVKKGLLMHAANNYKSAIEAAGGVCAINPEEAALISLDVELPPPADALPNSSVTTEEHILFQGDVILYKSAMSVVQGDGNCTAQRFVFSGDKKGDITINRDDVETAEEENFKWTVKMKTGDIFKFSASNTSAFRHAMLTLAGHEMSAQLAHMGIPDDRDRSFRRIVTDDSGLS